MVQEDLLKQRSRVEHKVWLVVSEQLGHRGGVLFSTDRDRQTGHLIEVRACPGSEPMQLHGVSIHLPVPDDCQSLRPFIVHDAVATLLFDEMVHVILKHWILCDHRRILLHAIPYRFNEQAFSLREQRLKSIDEMHHHHTLRIPQRVRLQILERVDIELSTH